MRQQLRLCWIPIGDWMPVFDVWQFVTNSITLRKNEGNYHLQPSLSHPISQGLLTFSKNPPWMTFLNRNKWHFCYLYSSNKYKKRLIYNAHLKKKQTIFHLIRKFCQQKIAYSIEGTSFWLVFMFSITFYWSLRRVFGPFPYLKSIAIDIWLSCIGAILCGLTEVHLTMLLTPKRDFPDLIWVTLDF